MRPIVVTVGPLAAASANAIALSQTPTTGPLTLNGALASGGVATLPQARQVLITTTGNESAKTFTVTGTSQDGGPQSEVVSAITSGTAKATVLSYLTVTSIVISADAAGALTVGTNGVADSAWVRLDEWASPITGVQCVVSGTGNYTVQQTFDNPNSATDPVAPSAMTWTNSPDLNVVNVTASGQVFYNFTPIFVRLVLNSGTGSVRMTVSQSGSVTY